MISESQSGQRKVILLQTASSKHRSLFIFLITVLSVSTHAKGPIILAISSWIAPLALITPGRMSVIRWNEKEPREDKRRGSHFKAKVLMSGEASFCYINETDLWETRVQLNINPSLRTPHHGVWFVPGERKPAYTNTPLIQSLSMAPSVSILPVFDCSYQLHGKIPKFRLEKTNFFAPFRLGSFREWFMCCDLRRRN